MLGVARRAKAGDDKSNVRKLCGLASLLAGAEVDSGAVGESDDGGVVAGLLYKVCLCMHCITVAFRFKERNVQTSGFSELECNVSGLVEKMVEVRGVSLVASMVRRRWRCGAAGGRRSGSCSGEGGISSLCGCCFM